VYLVLAAGVGVAVNATNLNVIRADIQFRRSSQELTRGQYPEAVTALRRTVDLQPNQDAYRLFLGKVLVQQAQSSDGSDTLMQQAEHALLKARDLSPLDPKHRANLARLHRAWAQQTEPGSARDARFEKALSEFEKATELNPNTPYLWNDRAAAYLAAGDTAAGEDILQHSLDLDTQVYQTHLLIGNLRFAQKRWKDAVAAYEETLRLEPRLPAVRLSLAVAKAQADRQEADSVLEIR
jgi:tetratricopeptide (TPR) repeat protein